MNASPIIVFSPMVIVGAALLAAFAVILILRLLLTPRVTTPSCARCRYDITGLPSTTCPECGSDLRHVGILRPDSRRPIGWLMATLLWTMAVASIALIAIPEIDRRIPQLMQATVARSFGSPSSGQYDSINVDGSTQWRGPAPAALNQFKLTLTKGQQTTRPLHVDLSGRAPRCWFTDAAGEARSMNITIGDSSATDAVLAWLADHGIDASRADVRREAQAISGSFDNSGTFSITGGGVTLRSSSTRSLAFSSSSGMRTSSGPFSSTSTRASTGPAAEPYRRHFIAAGAGGIWLLGLAIVLLWLRLRHVGRPLENPTTDATALSEHQMLPAPD